MASKPRLAEQQRAVTLLTQAVNILRNDSVVPSPATISPQSEIVRLFSPYRCTNTTGKVRGGSGTSGGCFSGNTSLAGIQILVAGAVSEEMESKGYVDTSVCLSFKCSMR